MKAGKASAPTKIMARRPSDRSMRKSNSSHGLITIQTTANNRMHGCVPSNDPSILKSIKEPKGFTSRRSNSAFGTKLRSNPSAVGVTFDHTEAQYKSREATQTDRSQKIRKQVLRIKTKDQADQIRALVAERKKSKLAVEDL
jgi:hypothetical protein